ncbi:pilus assembly protein [Nocardioides mangrovicus]|uniref:Pilus assembly protein n=1 Tax=Nocardioides mangrovicus TaxID=2478913 RepID=A0A3L8P3Z8_9ACTN|nr:TadE family protein [Nocardioides mangrovicus]RLV49158.1 pilus assembly protein [Nocardioides mangrovicus]
MHELRRRRRRGERGAVALEAALIFPVLMLLVFGMIDMSLMLRDYVTVTSSTRAATRFVSAEAGVGPCTSTDTSVCPSGTTVPQVAQDAADRVQGNLVTVPASSVNYLLVYEANQNGYPCASAGGCNAAIAKQNSVSADSFNGPMPSTCTGYDSCVKFKWNATAKAFRYDSGSWNSTTINACVTKEDNVGVYVNLSHNWLTGLPPFTGSMTLADRSVTRFEPLTNDICAAGTHP